MELAKARFLAEFPSNHCKLIILIEKFVEFPDFFLPSPEFLLSGVGRSDNRSQGFQ